MSATTSVTASRMNAGVDGGTSPALAALLVGTFVGTVSNNIVNVPLTAILDDFEAPLSSGIFVVVAFLLTFAAAMPLAGWIGDRFGRRRVYCAALIGTAICSLGAALAPSLPVLVMWRSFGGVAAAAFAPAVMGLIAWLFGPARRARAVGAWAAVNGIGQAMGPSLGGVVSDLMGWRWVFVPLIPAALIGYFATMKFIPRYPAKKMQLDWVGAITLTCGAGSIVLGISLASQGSRNAWLSGILVVAGIALVSVFVAWCLRAKDPFVPIDLVLESRFLRSALAAFAQMFALGATLLALPLYLTSGGSSTTSAGLVLFVLPLSMTVSAPVVGRYVDRLGGRMTMRCGLSILIVGLCVLATILQLDVRNMWSLSGVLIVVGVGVAMVQTPAAAGSTRSPAGAVGTGLGLFNLIRFGGSAVGAAWVGIAVNVADSPFALLFGITSAVVAVGFAATFVGEDPIAA
ncbi:MULTISPECIES: MFS transporter [Rhodococcus]|uniref:MFS transporter n=1 Tax=Rhodococcus globerulus TaxID=33008 RepID=A0ABU4BTK8_RHOGO|nr:MULTISPECIES: MFS transporter [Rhodococcus]MDV6267514.1 MFS transporter [Rhodococcus globerulus]MDV8065494.1 MFS transporter [Rhodococcus sp. IEGM 1366]